MTPDKYYVIYSNDGVYGVEECDSKEDVEDFLNSKRYQTAQVVYGREIRYTVQHITVWKLED